MIPTPTDWKFKVVDYDDVLVVAPIPKERIEVMTANRLRYTNSKVRLNRSEVQELVNHLNQWLEETKADSQ
jgi:hypothetical protein